MFRLKNFCKSMLAKYLGEEVASVLPVVALTFPVVLGMIGLGTDAGLWMANKRSLQTAADAAVLAAGWELAMDSEGYMQSAAVKEARNNGYDPSLNGSLELTYVSNDGEATTLGVIVTQDADTFFSKIIFSDPIQISAYAEAYISGLAGEFCVLSLDADASGAFTTSGSVDVNAPDCGIAVNSSADDAISMNGNIDITVDTVDIVGGHEIRGGSAQFNYSSLTEGAAVTADPYEDQEAPESEECDRNSRPLRITSSTTLSPGTYCGGISISGNVDVEFESGVYVIDGGDFNVTGGGSLTGDEVSFFLTGSGNDYAQLDISGGKEIEFTAPEAGDDMEGIVFMQDRNAPSNGNTTNKIVGTADIVMEGVAYFPSQDLWFGGNATFDGGEACTKLIARTVTLAGNPQLGNSCENVAVEQTGSPTVKLSL